MKVATMDMLRDRIVANFAGFERIALDLEDRRPAAVAIVVAPHADEPAFIITRRAAGLRRNAGNWALPGGGFDDGEDAIDAAIRETKEEVGVALDREAALGLLDDFITLSGHRVTPVVLFSPLPVALTPDPLEVGHAWFVPVADLDHPDAPMREDHPDGGEPILRMHVRGSWVNPPTAAFLYQFREVAIHGRPTRVAHIGQPPWTAR
jgi:8-oxo-dGTP pyrophosphatase MutT (NUDIX family)